MARVIEAVQIFKKVEDVTAAKDDPSPVYIMDELADMARGSVESSEKIADRIAKRLQNKSPVVKFKALRLIRHLVNKGCGHFQRFMQRHAELVRGHISFKGEPDPYKGDTPNQRVRDAAREAAESLFNTVMAQPVNALGSRIQGFGSSAAPASSSSSANNNHGSGHSGSSFSGAAAPSGASGSRMVGFGSSGNAYTAPSAAGGGANGAAGGFSGFGFGQKGVNRPLTGGYGAEAGSGSTSSGGHGGGGGGYKAPAVAAVEVLGSEDQLVDGICTPSGLRLAPDADDLRRFVEAVGSLDGLKVAELLRDKMDASGPWQQQLRALYALEAVLLQGASQACGEVAVMFQSDPGPVQAAASHTQATLRERASRVLKLLLGDDAAAAAPRPQTQAQPAAAAAAAGAPAAQQQPVDLLGGLDMLGGPPPGPQPPQQQQPRPAAAPTAAAAAPGSPGDIFSGLAVPAGPTAPQQGYGAPYATAAGSHGAPVGGYGQQPSYSHPPAQQQQQQQQAAPRPAALDPFEPLAPSTAPAVCTGSASTSAQPWPAYQQHPSSQPQQHPYQQPPQSYGVGHGMGGPAPQAPVPPGPPGPSYSSAPPRPAAQGPQARNPGAPLDDMFADMSLSGAAPGPASTSHAGGMYAGGGGSGAYGPVGGVSGGAGQYGAASSVSAYGGAGAAPNAAAGYGSTGYSPNGGLVGGGPGPQGPSGMGPGGGVGGVGTPLGVGTQYGGPPQQQQQYQQHQQYPVAGPMGHMQQLQQQQQQQYKPVPQVPAAAPPGGEHGDLLGGHDLLGPGPAPPAPPGGPGGWQASGAPGGGYGSMGLGGPSGPGMVVGPGGQVRYVGGPSGPGAAGPAAGGVGPGGGWQHQPYGAQQQQQPYGGVAGGMGQHGYPQPAGGMGPGQQKQQGGAAFDFVLDQFKK